MMLNNYTEPTMIMSIIYNLVFCIYIVFFAMLRKSGGHQSKSGEITSYCYQIESRQTKTDLKMNLLPFAFLGKGTNSR